MQRWIFIPLLLVFSLACLITPLAGLPTKSTEISTDASLLIPTKAPSSAARPAVQFDPGWLGSTQKDITYCTLIPGQPQKMDIYYPTQASTPWPVVMYVHGGAWQSGDKKEGAGFRDVADLQKEGFLVVSINYRLAPQYKFPAQIQDVKCAVRYLRAHSAEYNLDPNRFGVWGGSAGGHLVALLGTSDASAGWDVGEYLNQSSRVQAVVDMFGPADLTRTFDSSNAKRAGSEMGTAQVVFGANSLSDPILSAASPVTHVTADDPPFLILHGDKDAVVPLEQSTILSERLKSAGVPVELIVVHNAGHSFIPSGGSAISPSRLEIRQKITAFFKEWLN